VNEVGALRRLLGWLLLWALLPLPFLYIILPTFWLVAGAAGVFLVVRPETVLRPSKTVLNVAAVAIFVAVVAAGGLNVGPLRPLGHLLLLLTSIRLLAVDDRRGFLRGLALVGMVWVVSVASSTHMTAALYFVASAAIGWWVGIRVHLSGLGLELQGREGELPRPRHVVIAVTAALLIAAPFFVAMPRLGSPWVAGRSFSRTTGFSPDVDLSKLGRLTESQEVALVVRSAGGEELRDEWTRFRGTAFDQVMAGSWIPRRADARPLETSDGVARLRPGARRLDDLTVLDIDLLKPRRYLMLPPGAVALEVATPVAQDVYGGLLIGYRRGRPISYRVWVGEPAPPAAAAPGPRDLLLPRDNLEVRALSQSVAGDLGSARARADAVERFLQTDYDYSLDSGVLIHTVDPVAWFLLERKEGHCEFFAGAMVVMLRHLGVPARMVGGYSGGDISPDGDELVVREANAHAWVEAWLGDGLGWVSYDPTPPSGVPGLGSVSGWERARWAWQRAELLWDQKLLTFGLGEQLDLVEGFVEWIRAIPELMQRRSVATSMTVVAALIVAGSVLRLWWVRRVRPWRVGSRRTHGPASRAVSRLARALIPVGGVVPPWSTVRSIGRQAAAFWPRSAPAVEELVARAEDELYGFDRPRSEDSAEVRELWKRIRQGMKNREMTI
jgi:transglutaminase-like putative cysteine protease